MSDPRVSIVIVSYNTRDMTLACIRSVYEQAQDTAFELIVVDNISKDGSADAIASAFPQVRLIRSSENLGFARGTNLGVATAASDLVLLLNPDTLIRDHAVDRLLAFSDAYPKAGIWGGRTLFSDGSLNPTSCWRFVSLWSVLAQAAGLTALWRTSALFNPEGYGGWQRDNIREVDIVSGCFLLIRHQLWDLLKGFDETFFMYAEEADLCFRAREFGARPIFTPDATIVHYGGALRSASASKSAIKFAGKITFIRKHWPPFRQLIGIEAMKLGVIWRVLAYSLLSRIKPSKARRALAGEWKAVWSRRSEWTAGYAKTRD